MLSFFKSDTKKNLPPVVEVQEKVSEYSQYKEYFDGACKMVKDHGGRFISHAQECNETQQKIVATARSIFDITAVCMSPVGAVVGAVLGVPNVEKTKEVCSMIDGAMHGVWKDLSFEAKLVTVGVGVVAAYMWFPVVSTVAHIYAVKVGAEFAIKNKNIEHELHQEKVKAPEKKKE